MVPAELGRLAAVVPCRDPICRALWVNRVHSISTQIRCNIKHQITYIPMQCFAQQDTTIGIEVALRPTEKLQYWMAKKTWSTSNKNSSFQISWVYECSCAPTEESWIQEEGGGKGSNPYQHAYLTSVVPLVINGHKSTLTYFRPTNVVNPEEASNILLYQSQKDKMLKDKKDEQGPNLWCFRNGACRILPNPMASPILAYWHGPG